MGTEGRPIAVFFHAECRASQCADASTAPAAVRCDRHRLERLEKLHARALEHQHCHTLAGKSALCGFNGGCAIERVDRLDHVASKCTGNLNDRDGLRARAHERHTRARMGLRTRHGRRCVVKHAQHHAMAVVDGVCQARHGGGEERRVADEANMQRLVVTGKMGGSLQALGHRHAGAHAQAGVRRLKRLGTPQRIAADIAAIHDVLAASSLLDSRKRRPVGASSAQDRRARRHQIAGNLDAFGQARLGEFGNTEELGDDRHKHVGRILAANRGGAIKTAVHGCGARSDVGIGSNRARHLEKASLHDGLELLDNEGVRQTEQKVTAKTLGERIGRSHLQQAVRGQLGALRGSCGLQALQCLERITARIAGACYAQKELVVVAHVLVELVEFT